MAESTAAAAGFLQYHEPDIISILVLVSFLLCLSSLGWVFNKLIRAGLIGQILLGILYGAPVGNILNIEWQETFLALGYIGLILIIFEGGLTIRLDLLKANFLLSLVAAAIGIITPIALCYLLLYLGFHYGALETFIVGAALSTTSIGTTFIVLSSSKQIDFTQSKVGTVLISAALFDDVVGLIMVSIISSLGAISGNGSASIGWIVGRPILVSVAIGAISPLLAIYAAGPFYRRWAVPRIGAFGHKANICIMTLILSAHLVICAYAGASLLFGAFLAGTFLSTLPTSLRAAETERDEAGWMPAFHRTFEKYISGAQTFVLEPLFFASIGFAIPFKRLWTGTIVWRGIVFSLLMAIGKAVVGLSVPMWDTLSECRRTKGSSSSKLKLVTSHWAPATLLGMAMVARGEIGLLIIQLGLNDTSFLSEEAFLVAIWAIVLNTVIGPMSVGLLLRKFDRAIADNPRWGIQNYSSE
ncbi:hypothetical protein N0V93_009950 [Gnomoniopsis smithogilvyi]|uniref:Cation/H+ exchanger transmembrane domain-containing protein n=1 Tax=Gnomoniopsis smithogilvyi TaxID=1191159 RepID=A0A9W8YJ43_9PEZI|nr:hypothetical protein N0V93_009950 [Gnomoniopsis smithogilvyi]